MKRTVIIQFDIEGFHLYPNAPEQVAFLADNHRHTFGVKCGYKVSHHNREKEIFIQRDKVKTELINSFGYPCQFGARSCESIAEIILESNEADGMVWVEVWEENTGGARVEL
jgi:hypothetical protein